MNTVFLTIFTIGLLYCTLVQGKDTKKSSASQTNETWPKQRSGFPSKSTKGNDSQQSVVRIRRSDHHKKPKSFLEGILYQKRNKFDLEANYPKILSGKLKPNGQNWFLVLPTPVLTHRVSLRTIVGLYVTTLGHRRINQVVSEALRFRKDSYGFSSSHWAESHLLYFITFLKEGICTFGVVCMNKQIYKNESAFTRFLFVTSDYLMASAHLYKHAVSKYKQIHANVAFPSVYDIMRQCLKRLPSSRECLNPRSDILTKYKCLPTCKSNNTCKKKAAYLPKLMTNVLHFFISEFSTYEV